MKTPFPTPHQPQFPPCLESSSARLYDPTGPCCVENTTIHLHKAPPASGSRGFFVRGVIGCAPVAHAGGVLAQRLDELMHGLSPIEAREEVRLRIEAGAKVFPETTRGAVKSRPPQTTKRAAFGATRFI